MRAAPPAQRHFSQSDSFLLNSASVMLMWRRCGRADEASVRNRDPFFNVSHHDARVSGIGLPHPPPPSLSRTTQSARNDANDDKGDPRCDNQRFPL